MREWHVLTSRSVTASVEKVSVKWDVPACVFVCVFACVRAVVGIRTGCCAENKCWFGEPEEENDVSKQLVLRPRILTGSHDDNYHCHLGVAQSSLLLNCRLDRREILVQFPTRTRYFLWYKSVQTSYGASWALYSIGPWVLSPNGVQLTHQFHTKAMLRMRGAIHPFPPYTSMTYKGISFIRVIHNPWTWVIRICCRLAYWRHCKHTK
jgi:hypothetical protein